MAAGEFGSSVRGYGGYRDTSLNPLFEWYPEAPFAVTA